MPSGFEGAQHHNRPHYFLSRAGIAATSVLLASALAGCANMFTPPQPTCPQTHDWQAYGRWEVMQGHGVAWADRHNQVCAQSGQPFDRTAWMQGWQQGLQTFCTQQHGAQWGKAGNSYNQGFCPTGLEPQFLEGYVPAYEHWKFSRKLRQMQQQMDDNTRQLNDVVRKQARPGLSPTERADLRARQAVLENTIRNLRSQMQTEVLIQRAAP